MRFKGNKLYKVVIVAIATLGFFACNSNQWEIDVSEIDLELKILHFEKALFDLPKDEQYASGVDSIQKEYGQFFDLFTGRIINVGSSSDLGFYNNLNGFISDPDMQVVYGDCMNEFSDTEQISQELTQAFKHYKYYFPKKPVPDVVSFVSGFNATLIVTDSILAFGLDMYLGKNYAYYQMLQLPQFKRRKMTPSYIVPDCMRGWISSDYMLEESQDLAGQMIYHGKLMYLMNALMPGYHDSLIFGFTSTQLQWCKVNEPYIWSFFIDNELLYSQDPNEIIKYVGEAPFTTGFSKESPGCIGWWLGWNIVNAYMNSHPEISLSELMGIQDAHKLLTESGYKPKW